MSHQRGLRCLPAIHPRRAILVLASLALINCGSSDTDDDGNDPSNGGKCFPDSDGLTGGSYTFAVTVTDTGFSKTVIASQNDSMVTLTLTNAGTTTHGFAVDCVSVLTSYPQLPAMCPSTSCFPDGSLIAPIAPGTSQTVTFNTPTPDGLIYPFRSSDPNDSAVAGLNEGQWSLM